MRKRKFTNEELAARKKALKMEILAELERIAPGSKTNPERFYDAFEVPVNGTMKRVEVSIVPIVTGSVDWSREPTGEHRVIVNGQYSTPREEFRPRKSVHRLKDIAKSIVVFAQMHHKRDVEFAEQVKAKQSSEAIADKLRDIYDFDRVSINPCTEPDKVKIMLPALTEDQARRILEQCAALGLERV